MLTCYKENIIQIGSSKYVIFKIMKKSNPNEPKTWSELVKQYEKDRNKPPPKEYYVKARIVEHPEGGIFAEPVPDVRTVQDDIPIDTSIYLSTTTFEPPPAQKPRNVRPKDHDQLGPIFHWDKFDRRRPPETSAVQRRPTSYERDFNAITGKPTTQTGFKSSIKDIISKRDFANSFRMSRAIDPISNTFHTPELEQTRVSNEILQREAQISQKMARLPKNERRSRTNSANIVTGEIHDIKQDDVWKEFGESNVGRAVRGQNQEKEIVERREIQSQKQSQRTCCRFNNGRSTMQRDWNIINGNSSTVAMDSSVKMQPSVWAWCQAERI